MRPARTLARIDKADRTEKRAPVPDKREAILRAATHVFARNGYASSKVSDIARHAGVADGTVYLYFKNKEDVLHSIFDRHAGTALAAAREQLAASDDPRERLRRIAETHLGLLGADRDLAIVFQVELRSTTKFVEEFTAAGLAAYVRLIREAFEEGQRRGIFRPQPDAKILAKAFFGALDEMATSWILSNRRYPLAPLASDVLDIFLNGVCAR